MTWFKRKKRCCECRASEGPFVLLFEWATGQWVCLPCAERTDYLSYLQITPRS